MRRAFRATSRLRGRVILGEVEVGEGGEEAVDLGVLDDDETGEVARDDASEAAQQGLDLQEASAPLLGLQRPLHPVPRQHRHGTWCCSGGSGGKMQRKPSDLKINMLAWRGVVWLDSAR